MVHVIVSTPVFFLDSLTLSTCVLGRGSTCLWSGVKENIRTVGNLEKLIVKFVFSGSIISSCRISKCTQFRFIPRPAVKGTVSPKWLKVVSSAGADNITRFASVSSTSLLRKLSGN